ncbi:elongation factor B, polypeptide 2 [Octopus vulgaris]|uniref:Elongin-B n=1 Tax=Octopus vulgaris TaxID=6645 RepID=A0AA36FPI9_OCTVU|nr:elongation factor B, polypeptide 2 [Octopus vulgaris]
MDVFLMIRRKKCTIFTDVKENTTIYEVKKIVEGILKVPPENQRLFRDETALDDNKTLSDCGYTSSSARAQAPATIGLAFKAADGEFEALELTSLSSPPELPDVMKPQDSTTPHVQEQATA